MQVDERFEVGVSKRDADRSLSAILLTITKSKNDVLHVFLNFNVQKKGTKLDILSSTKDQLEY